MEEIVEHVRGEDIEASHEVLLFPIALVLDCEQLVKVLLPGRGQLGPHFCVKDLAAVQK
jgi:hypothetical protein